MKKEKQMINKLHLKLIAGYASELYLPKVSAPEIYKNILSLEKNVDIQCLLDNLFEKYKKNITISKDNFVTTLIDIYNYLVINKVEVDKTALDYESVMCTLKKEFTLKDHYLFEKITYPLYLFTKNLYYQLILSKAKTVYFFSREGQFLKKLFDEFQEENGGPRIKTEYLYVSRASTFLGTLDELDKEDFKTLFLQYPKMSLKTFCLNLAFQENDIKSLEKRLCLDFNAEIDDLKKSSELKRLVEDKEFIKHYENQRKAAKNNFIKYLSQFGDDYKSEIFVVDVGWKGTIQNNIQKILPQTKVKGFYLGLVHYDKIEDYHLKKAVLFENSMERRSANGVLYNSNRSIFEILLGADHGSTKNYEINGNLVVPILNTQAKEQELYKLKIKPIQDNIYRKFKQLTKILKYSYYDQKYIEKVFNYQFFKLMFNPSKKEIEEYKCFYHFENFGVMNYSYFNKNKKISFLQKMRNYRHFRLFIQNDDSWQYLKLHNNGMLLGKVVLYIYKKKKFKKSEII